MGDFNVDFLRSVGNNVASKFYNSLQSYFYTPFILQPTRLRSKTLIDNIFFNSVDYHSHSGNILFELSDHLTLRWATSQPSMVGIGGGAYAPPLKIIDGVEL